MRYEGSDGHVYEAETAEELVGEMHQLSLDQEVASGMLDDSTWMKKVARRVAGIAGKPVRHSGAAEFVADLIAAGFLTPSPERK